MIDFIGHSFKSITHRVIRYRSKMNNDLDVFKPSWWKFSHIAEVLSVYVPFSTCS